MLLRQMKYFVAVIDCNSFTEAAEQCYISQSAISQQIQALERELGVELIHRENRRFTITPTGQYFYSHCKAILSQVDDLIREIEVVQLQINYLDSTMRASSPASAMKWPESTKSPSLSWSLSRVEL